MRENDRPDAVFRDPFARRLAGDRGEQIIEAMPSSKQQTWAWVTRTYLFDQFISEQVTEGVDMVVNLAAGVDARPYRMELPASLKWVEVDLPDLLQYKQEILRDEKPVCSLDRVSLDLSDKGARRELFDRLGRQAHRVLILSEGILVYLTAEEVGSLAEDLARPSSFQRWVLDLASPGLLRMHSTPVATAARESGRPLEIRAQGGAVILQAAWLEPNRSAFDLANGRATQAALALDAIAGDAAGINRRAGLAPLVGDLLAWKRMTASRIKRGP